MISFPNAKINIGLNVIEKRADNYHHIESVFYPIMLSDAMEATKAEGFGSVNLTTFGNEIPGSFDSNLCVKAYNLLNTKFKLPSINLGLLKHIPMGGGLGGGSSDAIFFIKLLNKMLNLRIDKEEMKVHASKLGSDCTFFVDNVPSFVSGTGDSVSPIQLDLSKYFICIAHPKIHVDTKNAYSLITPHKPKTSLRQTILETPVHTWKETVVNDFEKPIFNLYPELGKIKNTLYTSGALYASMTGSGSALYGIFNKKPYLAEVLPACKIWILQPNSIR